MTVRALIAVVLAFVTAISAQDLASTLESRDLTLADVPACGVLCMLSTVPATGCALSDLSCVCHNDHLAHTLSACMLANCTMADSTRTAKVQAGLCNLPNDSKRTELFLYTGIVYFIAVLFVTLRITGKVASKRLGSDDLVVVAALGLTAVPLGCIVTSAKIGFGEHLWNVGDGALLPILRFFLVSSSTYVIVLGLIKVSIILFYFDIFRTPRFTIPGYTVLSYIILSTIIIFFMTIFACTPISSFWNRNIKGKCLNIQALAYANSASAIVQDLILLLLPLFFIRNLEMKRYKKFAVALMFCIGSFGCIATIIRLKTILKFGTSIDPTWDYVPVTIWTELELAAGFICVSLPSIRVLVVRILPKRVKDMFNITSLSDKGSSGPNQINSSTQKGWKRPTSWMDLSADVEEIVPRAWQRKSFMSTLWQRNSGMNFMPHKHSISPDKRDRSVELLAVPRSPAVAPVRQSWNSQGSQADPRPGIAVIGCLPESNFSDLDLVRATGEEERKRSRNNNV